MITKEEFYNKYVDGDRVIHCNSYDGYYLLKVFCDMNDVYGLVDYSLEDFGKDYCFDIYDCDIDYVDYYVNHGYDIVELDLLDFTSKVKAETIEQKLTKYEQLVKILGVEVGEEFRLKFSSGKVSKVVYKIEEDNIHYSSPSVDNGKFLPSDIAVRTLMSCEIVKLPWKPEYGEIYYYLNGEDNKGYGLQHWTDEECDENLFKRGFVYKTEEEVKEAVKKLGWVTEY